MKDWDAFWRNYTAGLWEPETRDLLHELLKPGDLFVDIGAWIGPVTLWALECGAKVIAIEPDPVAFDALTADRLCDVEYHQCAITLEDGPVRLAPRRGQLGNSMTRITDDGPVHVLGARLETILGDRVPRLVKMDVEGYETTLLPMLAPALAAQDSALQVALHPHLTTAVEPAWFDEFAEVRWPDDPRGNLVAIP